MSNSDADAPRISRRWPALVRPAVVVLGLGALVIGYQFKTASDLDRGKAALDSDDPAAARGFLDRFLASRPESAEAHFRAGQAARRCGDLPAAESHLDKAAKLGWDAAAIRLELALVRAQGGDLRSVEHILLAVDQGQPEARHVFAVLIPAYMMEFRWTEAGALAEKWAQLQPESSKPWSYQGEILERLRKKNEAVNALRQAVRLDPTDRKSRLSLARMLLETRQPAGEAAEHLEWLMQSDPANRVVLVQLAVCREAQGRSVEAVALLDRLIAENPGEAKAQYHRGRLELNSGRPATAIAFLRRSAELDPSDLEILYSLFLCTQQVGTPEEARAAEARWRQGEADLKRVAELARAISADPHDPRLRAEMGELFLKNGREQDGVRWLESALREQPNYAPAHRLLAAHYERVGQTEKAARHRTFARPEVRDRD